MKKTYELDFYGKNIVVETGELAKQSNGSVLVRSGESVVLTNSVMSKKAIDADFFPLMVVYQEKLYSVGKIPGGFIKREGRPTDNATLSARLIDRPLRPLFADGFRNEVQVINTVLSVDPKSSPEMMAMFGSSLSLSISDIPFDGPIAGVVVGRINGELIINPSEKELENSDINLIVAGTKDAINMVESSASEVSEEEMIDAIMYGHEAIVKLVEFQEMIVKEIGKEKVEVELVKFDEDLVKEVNDFAKDDMYKAVQIKEKLKKYEAIDTVIENTINHFNEKNEGSDNIEKLISNVKKIVHDVEADAVRSIIVKDKIRPDGREMKEIRDLSGSVDLLPRTHGSSVFTRGETQALAVTTLGALNEHQIIDGLGIEDQKRFMLHYNFPPFCVGETGRYGPPGRREVGHGALGEKALLQVLPNEEDFPYTIRIVSEVLESNGSSSQATICAGCMSLMAAGVPIKAPVAGIAMGLVKDEDDYTVLTDIQGLEDHMGDMDFKVAGTKDGICALQMDIKIKGVTKEIMKEALEDAKEARIKILDFMTSVIPNPRKELGKYAPKTERFKIKPEKIKEVIGRGGETITKIIQDASNVISVNDKNAVKIDIDEEGNVILYHTDKEVITRALDMIKDLTKEVEKGEIYNGKVVKVEAFGCFVELWPGTEGLVHISHLAKERVEKTEDVVKVGDEILVKSLGYDNRGRLNLSRKEAIE